MVKQEVEYKMMPRDEMEEVLARFGVSGLKEYKTLFGGYSGSNYKVEAESFVGCLKVCNGYTEAEETTTSVPAQRSPPVLSALR